MTDSAKSSLYEHLGGVYAIATVVDDFIDRIISLTASWTIRV